MKDEPGPSSEMCNWDMNVKAEEDDPLAVPFPAVKAEPGVSLCVRHISLIYAKLYWLSVLCLSVCLSSHETTPFRWIFCDISKMSGRGVYFFAYFLHCFLTLSLPQTS
jgi:hypothetical protein